MIPTALKFILLPFKILKVSSKVGTNRGRDNMVGKGGIKRQNSITPDPKAPKGVVKAAKMQGGDME